MWFDIGRKWLATVCVVGLALLGATTASAEPLVKLRAASLTLPVVNPVVVNVIKAEGFDKKHGIDLEVRPYPSISAFYASLATGEVDSLIGGPIVLQKLRNEGANLQIVSTMMRLSDLVVLTANPAIKSIADLKGKTLAADMGSQQYQVLALYANSLGLDLTKNVTVTQANFALARGQLMAGRVDAALVIEPIATAMLQEDPKLHIIFQGDKAWQKMTGAKGWELVAAMTGAFIQKHPKAVEPWIAALKDAADFMQQHPDEADAIAVKTVRLKPGLMREILEKKRWEFEVLPAWGPERTVMQNMIDRAVAAKFISAPRDDKLFYQP